MEETTKSAEELMEEVKRLKEENLVLQEGLKEGERQKEQALQALKLKNEELQEEERQKEQALQALKRKEEENLVLQEGMRQLETEVQKVIHDRDSLLNRLQNEIEERMQQMKLVKKTDQVIPVGDILAEKPLLRVKEYLPSLLHNESAVGLSPTKTNTEGFAPLEAPLAEKRDVSRWNKTKFYAHLANAENIRMNIVLEPGQVEGEENVSICTRIREFLVSDELANNLRGEGYEDKELMDEEEVMRTMLMGVYYTLNYILRNVLESFGLRFVMGSRAQGGVPTPSLHTLFKVDLLLQILGKSTNVMIIQENKLPFKFPGKLRKSHLETSDLFTYYYEMDEGGSSNVLKQIRTYMAIYHRRYGIITSLNCFTFVRFTDDEVFEVSERFWIDKDTGNTLCLMEMLIKFILMGLEDDIIPRPKFLIGYLKTRVDQEKLDKYIPYLPNINSTTTSNSTTTTCTTSSSTGGKINSAALFPTCWADLEDPARNTFPHILSKEQQLLPLGSFEGDAKLIGVSRIGEVYLKEWNGVKIVCKLLALESLKNQIDPSVKMLENELRREVHAYDLLFKLQGIIIPRFIRCGPLIPGICDVFATEYFGSAISASDVNEKQIESALESLNKIHSLGVSHGDLKNARNILLHDSGQIVFIDFGYAQFKDELSEIEWNDAIAEDEHDLNLLLKSLLRKRRRPADEEDEGDSSDRASYDTPVKRSRLVL